MTKIFADCADFRVMMEMAALDVVRGFTTNPTLLKRAGVTDYLAFAREVLREITDRPVCFETFADDAETIEEQAHKLADLGSNVVVKVPMTTTGRVRLGGLVSSLALSGVTVNVTAMTTLPQVDYMIPPFMGRAGYLSYFAGRVADTGRDPQPAVIEMVRRLQRHPKLELIWASPRQVLDFYRAQYTGCHIITMTPDLIRKLPMRGLDLGDLSLATVRQFYEDGKGYTI